MTIEAVAYRFPDPALTGPLQAFLERAMPEQGVCGEHDPRWLQVLAESLGHRPWVIGAWASDDGGDRMLVGCLPLMEVRSFLFGRFLISIPYLNRGSYVATTQGAAEVLVGRAVELARELDVQYLELRQHTERLEHPELGAARDDKFLMLLDLPDSEELLWKGFSAKVRNQIRKGDSHNLTIDWASGAAEGAQGAGVPGSSATGRAGGESGGLPGTGASEVSGISASQRRALLNDFYRVFAINMRDLGTPVFSRRLFESILRRFGAQAELAVVRCGGEPVAGALLIHDRLGRMMPTTQVPSASALRSHNSTNANMWMYHQLLLRAIEKGSARFDFGRSSEGSGTYRFKKQWGALPHPTIWQYCVLKGELGQMRPDHPSNQRKIRVWQKLPVWLTRLIGPGIVRGIP